MCFTFYLVKKSIYLFFIIDGLMSVWIFIQLGGKSWKVRLGRRDSTTANKTTAEKVLPSPISNLCTLIENFANQGLSMKDLVTLSGYVYCLFFN